MMADTKAGIQFVGEDKVSNVAKTLLTAIQALAAGLSNVNPQMQNLKTGSDQAAQGMSNLGTQTQKTHGFLGDMIKSDLFRRFLDGVGTAIKGAGNFIKESIMLASDSVETTTKLQAVYGDAANAMFKWSENAVTAMGMTQDQALKAAGTLGNLFRSMGIASDQAAEMSMTLTQLASDEASFNNMDMSYVIDKITSGLVGMTRPLKELGINITEVNLKERALALGLSNGEEVLNSKAKALASYSLIMEQSQIAQGDFVKTSMNMANMLRITKSAVEELKETFGFAFLPAATALVTAFGSIANQIKPQIEEISNTIRTWSLTLISNMFTWGMNMVESLASGITGSGAVINALQDIATYFIYMLKANSPPRLLPDLANWGAAAMASYLSGYTSEVEGADDVMKGWSETLAPYFEQMNAGAGFSPEMANKIGVRFGGGARADIMKDYLSSYAQMRDATEQVRKAQEEYDALTPEATREEQESAKEKLDGAKKVEDSAKQRFTAAQLRVRQEAEAQARLTKAIEQQRRATEKQTQAVERQAAVSEAAAAKKDAADQKALEQARLMWEMAQTDTAGKIKLIERESAKHEQGTVEWYHLETQKLGLIKQLEAEKEAATKKAGGGGLDEEDSPIVALREQISGLKQGLQEIGPGMFIDPLTMTLQEPPKTLWDLLKNLGRSLGGGFVKEFLDVVWEKLLAKFGLNSSDPLFTQVKTMGAKLATEIGTAIQNSDLFKNMKSFGEQIGQGIVEAVLARLSPFMRGLITGKVDFESEYAGGDKGDEASMHAPGWKPGMPQPVYGIPGDAVGSPAPVPAGGQKPDWLKLASGFNGVVTTATKMIVGEAGPERVQITPLNSQQPGSEPSGKTIIHNWYIRSTDPKKNTDEIWKILRAEGAV